MKLWLWILSFALLLSGCAGQPFSVEQSPTPTQVARSGETGSEMHWGGRIVAVKNLRDRSLVEVLSFPLDRNGQPQTDEAPQGRFIVERRGFLEPHEYAPDRLLEVRGRLSDFTAGQVGDAAYRYPVVMADRLVLWPERAAATAASPRINFGFGLSNHGGGVGMGVGF